MCHCEWGRQKVYDTRIKNMKITFHSSLLVNFPFGLLNFITLPVTRRIWSDIQTCKTFLSLLNWTEILIYSLNLALFYSLTIHFFVLCYQLLQHRQVRPCIQTHPCEKNEDFSSFPKQRSWKLLWPWVWPTRRICTGIFLSFLLTWIPKNHIFPSVSSY